MSEWEYGNVRVCKIYVDTDSYGNDLVGRIIRTENRWQLRLVLECGCADEVADGCASSLEECMEQCDEAALAYLAVRLAFRAVQWQRDIDANLACSYRRAMEGLVGEDGYLVRSTLDFEIAEHNLSEGYPVWQREPNSRGSVPNGT